MSFIIDGIIWLDEIVEKIAWKHSITPREAEEMLTGKCRVFKSESGRVEGENLYSALGKTKEGRYLTVFFIKKSGNKALIITARDMNKRERKRYGKK